jgi:hypothetical protein
LTAAYTKTNNLSSETAKTHLQTQRRYIPVRVTSTLSAPSTSTSSASPTSKTGISKKKKKKKKTLHVVEQEHTTYRPIATTDLHPAMQELAKSKTNRPYYELQRTAATTIGVLVRQFRATKMRALARQLRLSVKPSARTNTISSRVGRR